MILTVYCVIAIDCVALVAPSTPIILSPKNFLSWNKTSLFIRQNRTATTRPWKKKSMSNKHESSILTFEIFL